jgi:hypothetical protein
MPDPTPTPDQVNAYLDDAQKRYQVFGESDAMPRLLAAVEAVLKLAEEWKATSAQLGEMAERADARGADPLRTTLMDARAQAYQDNAQALSEAISAALLGEEKPHA